MLLVEDNPADALILMDLLEENGFTGTIHWVVDGEQALDFIFRRKGSRNAPRADCVLLDLNLPRVDGREVLRQLRSNSETRTIPVVILSTAAHTDDFLRKHPLPAQAHIAKPPDLEGYEALARRLITVELAPGGDSARFA